MGNTGKNLRFRQRNALCSSYTRDIHEFVYHVYHGGHNSTSGSEGSSGGGDPPAPATSTEEKKKKEKARVSRTSLILWHAHQNDNVSVRKLLEEDRTLVQSRDYDNRTPLHVAALHGWIDIAKCLIEYGADVNSQDRWRNTPLADAEGAKKPGMIELLKS
ncbi:hypothetical protein RND71_002346 [Anisodus tanguticus]|uniref:Uncharacterized protein n=1 Tax=Anisodus tanguticus TaxID=243964 RepID=A0AAE1VYL7_9SOLA|nr:hypothetical protein RND71_002346 [Anisodus tanguticus]